jgi:hypothetical protein
MLKTRNPSTVHPPAAKYSHSVEVPAERALAVYSGASRRQA